MSKSQAIETRAFFVALEFWAFACATKPYGRRCNILGKEVMRWPWNPKLGRVKDALLTVTDNVGHYKAIDSTDKYIVWAENGSGNPIRADNRCIQQVIRGTIDYFTKEENDANVDNIQEALDDAGNILPSGICAIWKWDSIYSLCVDLGGGVMTKRSRQFYAKKMLKNEFRKVE